MGAVSRYVGKRRRLRPERRTTQGKRRDQTKNGRSSICAREITSALFLFPSINQFTRRIASDLGYTRGRQRFKKKHLHRSRGANASTSALPNLATNARKQRSQQCPALAQYHSAPRPQSTAAARRCRPASGSPSDQFAAQRPGQK